MYSTFRVRFCDHENEVKSECALIQVRGSWGHSLGAVAGERGMPEVTRVLCNGERVQGCAYKSPILPLSGDL